MADQPTLSVAELNQLNQGRLPELVGMEITAIEAGVLRSQLTVRPALLAPNGYLHAATLVALADTTCGYGAFAHLPEGAKGFTTIELKSNFTGTVRAGVITCIARALHLGRTTQVWDAEIEDAAKGRIIAYFRCTQMVLWATP
ncbi:MAG: PaaI family thioesterase [Gammaproteobacteria bacterium]